MLLDDSTASAELTSAPSSPPNSTKPVFHHQSDALKPNPHPYPIKTTSTGVLTRSNSTTKSTTPYQYYVPQSPGSPSKDSVQHAQNGSKTGRGDKERRGGRHRYSKSLNSDSIPSPLPVPPGFAFGAGPGSSAGYRPRSDSNSLLSSASSQGDDVENADVFGQVADNDSIFIAGSESKSDTSKLLGSTFEPSVVGPGIDPEEGGASGGRRRTYRTIGRRTGGKVRGMVASFERSGDEEEGGNDEDGSTYAYSRRARHRSGSTESDQSTGSSSSSFSTASSGPFPPDVVETKLKPSLYENSRGQGDLEKTNGNSDEPTMEQLLAWGHPISQLHSGTGICVRTADEAALNVETIKLRDVDVQHTHSESGTTSVTIGTGATTATDNSNTIPTIPDFSSSISVSSIVAGASSAKTTKTPAKMDEGDSTELTVEQLLALTGPSYEGSNGIGAGADAWERMVGSTVKRVDGEAQGTGSKVRITTPLPAPPGGESLRVFVNGKSRRGKGSLMAKKDAEREKGRRLEDVFVPAGDAKLGGEIVPPPPPAAAAPAPVSVGPQVVSTKELKLEQEMSETREMVRALSARVASVEAKVGEMERVAGELKVRGRKLAEVEMKKDGEHQVEDLEERKAGGSVMQPRWLAASFTRAVVGISRTVGMLQFPFSFSPASAPEDSTTKSKPPSREVSRSRGNNGNGTPLWYKKSWTYYVLFLGLGACAFLLKEVVRRGASLKGRGLATRG